MIKIRKEHTELIVTNGQFDNLYKGLGFEIVDDKKKTIKPVVEPKVEEVKLAKEPEKIEEPIVRKPKGQNRAIQNRK